MPRNQSTAAQRAREAQRETGAKYTAALRQATKASTPPKAFSLRELLAESTTSPEWTGSHPDVDDEWAPRMFDSALLDGPVPYATVLLLAGDLASMGMSAEMILESRDGFSTAIVACGGRRFELVLSQDNWIADLCLSPGCEHHPVAAHFIPYCEYRHLAERSEGELVRMANDWGRNRREEFSDTPAAVHPGYEGDRLITAAIARGVFSRVATELVEACYEPAHMVDDVYSGVEAAAVRHAMELELLRLSKVASSAAAHIRKLAGGLCVCGASLALIPWAIASARFCSPTCAAAAVKAV